jgi:hypothetical protein
MTNSPTFVAIFDDADRTATRMTVWCGEHGDKLDMGRGVRLAQHAYRQRLREPPALVRAHFKRNDQTLENYNAVQLTNGGAAPEKGGAPTQAKLARSEDETAAVSQHGGGRRSRPRKHQQLNTGKQRHEI